MTLPPSSKWPSAATVISVISLFVSGVTAYATYATNLASQGRQIQNDRIEKFAQANSSLLEAASMFVSAVNTSTDLQTARDKFAAAIAQQIVSSNDLRATSSQTAQRAFSDYQTALVDLSKAVYSASNPMEMRLWAESFGRVLDTRSALTKQLQRDLGLGTS